MKRIRTADDLLALLSRCGGAIVHGGQCGPMEVHYALSAGRGYVNAAGDAFVLRARRTTELAASLGSDQAGDATAPPSPNLTSVVYVPEPLPLQA